MPTFVVCIFAWVHLILQAYQPDLIGKMFQNMLIRLYELATNFPKQNITNWRGIWTCHCLVSKNRLLNFTQKCIIKSDHSFTAKLDMLKTVHEENNNTQCSPYKSTSIPQFSLNDGGLSFLLLRQTLPKMLEDRRLNYTACVVKPE